MVPQARHHPEPGIAPWLQRFQPRHTTGEKETVTERHDHGRFARLQGKEKGQFSPPPFSIPRGSDCLSHRRAIPRLEHGCCISAMGTLW